MSKVLSALCLLPTLVMAAFIINCWDCTQATITLFGVVRCMLNNQLPLKQKYIIIIYLRLEQMDRNSFNINKNRHCYIIFSISLLFASSFSQTLVIFLDSSPLVCLALQGGSSCWPSKFGKISFADMWNSWRTFLKRRFNHESNWVQTLGKISLTVHSLSVMWKDFYPFQRWDLYRGGSEKRHLTTNCLNNDLSMQSVFSLEIICTWWFPSWLLNSNHFNSVNHGCQNKSQTPVDSIVLIHDWDADDVAVFSEGFSNSQTHT